MQNALHGPVFRGIFSISYEISVVVLIAAALNLALNIPMDTVGGFALLFGLTLIPLNYIYNLVFDKLMQRYNQPYYHRNFSFRLIHATGYEVLMLIISTPLIMHVLNFEFDQALTLNVAIGVALVLYNILVTWTFDYEPE